MHHLRNQQTMGFPWFRSDFVHPQYDFTYSLPGRAESAGAFNIQLSIRSSLGVCHSGIWTPVVAPFGVPFVCKPGIRPFTLKKEGVQGRESRGSFSSLRSRPDSEPIRRVRPDAPLTSLNPRLFFGWPLKRGHIQYQQEWFPRSVSCPAQGAHLGGSSFWRWSVLGL